MTIVTAVELGALAAAAWPVVRLLASGPLRRVAPRVYATLAGFAVAGAVAVAYLASHAPGWLHPMAVAGAAVAVAGGWRARPGYGRGRGLPPGSLSVARSVEAIVDRGWYARQHRRHGPVFKMAQFHRGAVCVDLELGYELLRRHGAAIGPSPQPFTHEIHGGFLRYMDAETHRLYGGLFRTAFSDSVVKAAEPETRAAAARALARMAEASRRGRAVPPAADLETIVFAAFARVMFAIGPAAAEFDRLERITMDLKDQPLSKPLTPRTKAALAAFRALVLDRAAELRRALDDGGAPDCALTALVRANPAMPDAVCADNLAFIMKISSANVVALLHWLVKMLAENRQWLDGVRVELDRDTAVPTPRLAHRIVMETLRMEQSEYVYRTIRETFEHGGFLYPKGWLLRLCVKESHRREEIFTSPTVFDPDRFLGRSLGKSEFSPFGVDRHACNGVALTYMIAGVLVEEMARGFDCAIMRDGHLERDFRHWSHWRPSSRLALAISPRAVTPLRPPREDRHVVPGQETGRQAG